MRFLEYVQMAVLNDYEESRKFLIVFRDLTPHHQRKVSFDDVCAAAGVMPSKLMSEIVSVGMECGAEVGDLVAAALHPKVVRQLAKSALRISGPYAELSQRDRKDFLQHQKFLPIPRGAAMHVNVSAMASATAQSAATASAEPSVPSFAEDMRSLEAPRATVERQVSGVIDSEDDDA